MYCQNIILAHLILLKVLLLKVMMVKTTLSKYQEEIDANVKTEQSLIF